MRTKALLGLAVLAAGAFTASAQIYSQNIVGYVNVQCDNLYTLVTTPLVPTSNATQDVLPGVPLGTAVFNFEGGAFIGNFLDEYGDGWTYPTKPIPNGMAYLIQNNTGNPMTVTFVGEVPTGTVDNPLAPGYNPVGSKVPQAGYLADLGLVSTPGDTVFKFKRGAFQGYFLDEYGDGWGSSEPDVDNVKGPMLNLGEGMLYVNTYGTATWSRTFTVQ